MLALPNCRHQSISHQHTNRDHHAETKAEKPSKNCAQDTFHSGERKLPQLPVANAGNISLADYRSGDVPIAEATLAPWGHGRYKSARASMFLLLPPAARSTFLRLRSRSR